MLTFREETGEWYPAFRSTTGETAKILKKYESVLIGLPRAVEAEVFQNQDDRVHIGFTNSRYRKGMSLN